MSNGELPEKVANLIVSSIDSIEMLRVLLFLHSRTERAWKVTEIVQELKSSQGAIQRPLDLLYSRKVLLRNSEQEGGHKYLPATPEIRATVDELNEAYRIKPYAVMELIFSNRDKAIQQLADAFRIVGKKEGS